LKIFMTLLVRDEADIIESNINFHLSIGVDHIIVTDNLSSDATGSLLRNFERRGDVTVIEERRDNYDQASWVTRMARMAARMGADWVINSDADEFWWPRHGDLRTALEGVTEQFGILYVHRHDFVPVTERAEEPFYQRMIYRNAVSVNALGEPLPGKVIHRANGNVVVAQGNHEVTAPGIGAVLEDGRIEILHFPMRSYPQFERKIRMGGMAYKRNPTPGVGGTWRYLFELYQQGALHDYWVGQARNPRQLARDVKSGILIRDERLRTHLQALRRQPAGRQKT